MTLYIRRAGIDDADAIAGWNVAMAWETESKALDPATIGRGVRAVFDEPRRGFYLIAELDGAAVTSGGCRVFMSRRRHGVPACSAGFTRT